MLFSLALILLIGFSLSGIFNFLKLPGFIGMIITGVLLGPYVLNLISPDILAVSNDLREIALIVILARAGMSLDLKDLKKVGRPAILMCFIPATFELIGVILLAPYLLKISYMEAAILGTVLAAVSPAVVVPKMIKLMEGGYGKNKSVPQLIMAGSSVDDVFVIVLFTAFLGMYQGSGFHISSLLKVPLSIGLGILFGIIVGVVMSKIFKIIRMRDTIKILLILSISFLFITIEEVLKPFIPISGLIAVMFLGITLLKQSEITAKRLSVKLSKIWVLAEIILFVLVGAAVDISYVADTGIFAVLLIFGELIFRMIGVFISLLKTNLSLKERSFCGIAYIPKATVQAAIGAVPLAAGVQSGNIILAVAVLIILITAPLGAIGIDLTYKKLLTKQHD